MASSLDRIVVRASRLHRAAETAAPQRRTLPEDGSMFRLAVLFLAVALVGALLGFGVVADLSFAAARIVFFVFLTLTILTLLGGVLQQGKFRDTW